MGEVDAFRAWCVPSMVAEGWDTRTASPLPAPAGASTGGEGGAFRGRPGLSLDCLPLDAADVRRLVGRLRKARASLLERPAAELADRLGRVGRRFLDPGDPIRARALPLVAADAGLSRPMAAEVVDGMARDWTPERLQGLLVAELGDPAVLDRFVEWPAHPGERVPRQVRAVGAALAVHLCSGSVPGVSTTSLVRSLLVKSPVLLKPGRGDVVLPVLFLEGLAAEDPGLAAAAAVIYWPGGEGAAEAAALAAADLVVVYGSDRSVAAVRARLPAYAPLVAYHHRVSAALVGRDALSVAELEAVASEAARAVALFDGRGCVSPRVVWVEEGGETSPRDFAAALARALEHIEDELPTGVLDDGAAADLQQIRGTLELRAAAGEDLAVWDGGSAPWTVVYEGGTVGGGEEAGGRLVRVRPVPDARELRDRLEPLASHLQTVAVVGLGTRRGDVAESLARIGVTRITPLSRAPWPPPWWHHDGRSPLGALVRWVDAEE